MRHFIANLISTFYSLIRFFLMKLFYFRRFHCFPIQRFSPNVIISISKGSTLRLGKTVLRTVVAHMEVYRHFSLDE